MMALNIYTKLGKAIQQTKHKGDPQPLYELGGLRLIKTIEEETEKDKSMSNLKGKIKEIKYIIEHF